MTDGYLMDARCIHGWAWYDCPHCEDPIDPNTGFLVEAVDRGVMLNCTVCGVHNWSETSRPLTDLIIEAEAHRRLCIPERP